MGYDREHLSKLLDFIRALYNDPANGEFAEGLRKLVGGQPSTASDRKVEKIEKYLGLDYGIDSISNPDYSFVRDDRVRNILDADYREMLRYIYGTRGHSVDFVEFTRFVNLQMEMLVNFYYDWKYDGDLQRIVDAIQPSLIYKISTPSSLAALSLNSKINGLKGEFSWSFSDIAVYLNIISVRNDASHRSVESIDEAIDGKNREISRLEQKAVRSEYETSRLESLKKEAERLRNFRKWLSPLPYGEVYSALKTLAAKVREAVVY